MSYPHWAEKRRPARATTSDIVATLTMSREKECELIFRVFVEEDQIIYFQLGELKTKIITI